MDVSNLSKSVAISPCGTFALVGSSSGGIDRFNLQSGVHRQRYPNRLTSIQAKRLQQEKSHMLESEDSTAKMQFARGVGKHSRAVTGIEVDNLNHTVISCGLDGKIKVGFLKYLSLSCTSATDHTSSGTSTPVTSCKSYHGSLMRQYRS